jgi:hypothetical protein
MAAVALKSGGRTMTALIEIAKWIASSAIGAAVIWYFSNRSLEAFKASMHAEIEGWKSRSADLGPRQRDLATKAFLQLDVADRSVRAFIARGGALPEDLAMSELKKITQALAQLGRWSLEAHIVMPKGVGDRLDGITHQMLAAVWSIYQSAAILNHSADEGRLVAKQALDKYDADTAEVILALHIDLRRAVGSDARVLPFHPENTS